MELIVSNSRMMRGWDDKYSLGRLVLGVQPGWISMFRPQTRPDIQMMKKRSVTALRSSCVIISHNFAAEVDKSVEVETDPGSEPLFSSSAATSTCRRCVALFPWEIYTKPKSRRLQGHRAAPSSRPARPAALIPEVTSQVADIRITKAAAGRLEMAKFHRCCHG